MSRHDILIVLLVLFCAYLWHQVDEAHDLAAVNYVLKEDDDCEHNQVMRLEALKESGW